MSEMLYDQIGRIAARSTNSKDWRRFIGAPVFDVTCGIDEFQGQDWNEINKAVPKRPPYDRMWCEWSARTRLSKLHTLWFRHGALLEKDESLIYGAPPGTPPKPEPMVNGYRLTHFMRLEKVDLDGKSIAPSNVPGIEKIKVGAAMFRSGIFSLWFTADWTTFLVDVKVERDQSKAFGMFGLPVLSISDGQNPFTNQRGTTVLECVLTFALLNCRHVYIDEAKPPKMPRAFKERGYPPACTVKTLKLEVPAEQKIYATEGEFIDALEEAVATGRTVREHRRRGFFRQLSHPRYKNPGWYWIRECVVGDKKLGVVVKDYKIAPIPEESSPNNPPSSE